LGEVTVIAQPRHGIADRGVDGAIGCFGDPQRDGDGFDKPGADVDRVPHGSLHNGDL